MKGNKYSSFLLEVGYEELPVRGQEILTKKASIYFAEKLKKERINFDGIFHFVTPRRLVIYIEKLNGKQHPLITKIQGPKKDIAFDKEDNPTPACLGFLKSHNATVKDIIVERTPKGEYIYLEKKNKGENTKTLLKKIIPDWLSSIPFPKSMQWDNSGLRFPRPIRWILCFFNKEILKIKIGNIKSCDFTILRQGANYHRFKIKNIANYFRQMEKNGIILSYEKRKKKIKNILQKKVKDINGIVIINPGLLNEVTCLCESPYPIKGEFDKNYLKLPKEVLLASMAKYQRVFAIKDINGKFFNEFIAILNGKPENINKVKRHYEYVLNARLWDAHYFYNEDLCSSLSDKVNLLSQLTMEEKLGSILDKVKIMQSVGENISPILDLKEDEKKNLLRAIYLSKADLVTSMVKEFPSLEGIIGGIYALKTGEKKQVSKAIYEHYNPKATEDPIPQTKLGRILSVLDKIYNIVGLLGLGTIPTGSYDPYSIRRQMHGVVRILSFNQIEIKLDELFDFFYNALESRLILDKEKLRSSFFEIAKDRFFNIMSEDIPQDLIKACINVNFQILFEVYLRVRMLLKIHEKKIFYKACKVVERTFKILKNFKTEKDVNTNLFSQEEEKILWNSYIKNKDSINNLIERRKYDEATCFYADVFYDSLHRFFDSVLVNVEDKEIRQNRKEMLYRINKLYTEKVAELQEMEVLKNVSK